MIKIAIKTNFFFASSLLCVIVQICSPEFSSLQRANLTCTPSPSAPVLPFLYLSTDSFTFTHPALTSVCFSRALLESNALPSFTHSPPPHFFSFFSVSGEQTCKQTALLLHRLLCVKPSGALSQGPSSRAPLLAFTNTSSAIKHNDSVKGVRGGGWGSHGSTSHTLSISLSTPHHQHQKKEKKKKNTCKPFVSPQICLSAPLPLPPPVNSILIFAREKKLKEADNRGQVCVFQMH